jgi:hypothetical protein
MNQRALMPIQKTMNDDVEVSLAREVSEIRYLCCDLLIKGAVRARNHGPTQNANAIKASAVKGPPNIPD